MAQHDYVIDNGPGLAVRTDINAALAAIQSSNSGTVEPAAKVPGQFWFNTTTGQLVYRNSGNTAWNPVSGLSSSGLTLELKEGTTVRGSIASDGGASAGTTAIRSFNNTGAQTGLFYVSSVEAGTDRNVISIYNNSDSAVWLRKLTGEIRGGLYNYASGSTEIRVYNPGNNALASVLGIDYLGGGHSYAHVWTWNSDNTVTDADERFRVGASRAMRWYYAQNGDVFLQETDDYFASHFIGLYSYSRATGNTTFPNKVMCSGGYELLATAGSLNGIYPGTGDGANLTTYNVMVRSWYGIGFPSSTDGVNRIYFNCRTGDAYFANRVTANDLVVSQTIYTGAGSSWLTPEGNVKFSGAMLGYGAALSDALAARSAVYTGGVQDETNFPLGHQVLVQAGDGAVYVRNGAYAVGLTSTYAYGVGGSPALAGTYRARGGYDSPGSGAWCYSFQRMA